MSVSFLSKCNSISFFFLKFPSTTQQRSDWTSDRIFSFSPTFTFTFHSGFFWSAQGFLDLSHSKTEWRGRSFEGLSMTFWLTYRFLKKNVLIRVCSCTESDVRSCKAALQNENGNIFHRVLYVHNTVPEKNTWKIPKRTWKYWITRKSIIGKIYDSNIDNISNINNLIIQ